MKYSTYSIVYSEITVVISVISMCVGNACCAPDPQRHLGLQLAHLWCGYCGLMVLRSGWHWWDGSHRTSPNPWKQNYSSLHKFQQGLDQLLNKKRSFSIFPSACRVPISQAVQHPVEGFVNTWALSLLCCCLSSPSQKSILISHFCRDVCLSSFSCLGLEEIETEGLRPPARDFVSQCSGALYGWVMNTNLIILGSPGWVFFC